MDPGLKQTISRAPTGKSKTASIVSNQEVCQLEQLSAENQQLHEKLKEKERLLDQLNEKNDQLASQLKSANQKAEKQLAEINEFKASTDIEKLRAIAISLMKFVAKPSEIADLTLMTATEEETESEQVHITLFFFSLH